MEWMFMPLRRYADFQGRSRRMEFWMWQLFLFLLNIVLGVLLMIVGGAALFASGALSGGEPGAAGMATMGIGIILVYGIWLLVSLALIIPNIAVAVRRLHDTGRTGFWLLAPLAPYILLIVAAATGSDALRIISVIAVFGLAIVLLVFYFLDGTPGENRFGADPKGRGEADVFA